MNKDQFAYLNEEIKALEAERNAWKERFHTTDNLLTVEKSKADEATIKLNDFLTELGLLKSKAERLAEALKTMVKHEEIEGWDQNPVATLRGLTKRSPLRIRGEEMSERCATNKCKRPVTRWYCLDNWCEKDYRRVKKLHEASDEGKCPYDGPHPKRIK